MLKSKTTDLKIFFLQEIKVKDGAKFKQTDIHMLILLCHLCSVFSFQLESLPL